MIKEGLNEPSKKNEALRKAKDCFNSNKYNEYKKYKRLVTLYILRIEKRAWEIAEDLLFIFVEEKREFHLVKDYSINTYIRHLS